ncbi:radical SAM protein [Flexistipes sp.]|uniref:radical SAM protein n=1 Tax=Flexistipes sp. TaxID=3088135 RepID=UPI002E1F615E|nr:radical SAM protein [Flexistipes sp.]
MLINLDTENIVKVGDRLFFEDALTHLRPYQQLRNDINSLGLEIADYDDELADKKNLLIDALRQKGAEFRNNNASIHINFLSKACIECKKGNKSITFFYSLACNRDCYFCSNKNQESYDYYVHNQRDILSELDQIKNIETLRAVAVTGGEPLLDTEKLFHILSSVNKKCPVAHTRLYTNGDLIDYNILENLQRNNLNEIRFSVKPDENGKLDESKIHKIILAKKYIPEVVVEMPVIPGSLYEMRNLLDVLNKNEITGVNLLEFLFPWVNPEEYIKRGFKIKNRPYKIFYSYTYAGGLPISGSEEECLELLLHGLENNYSIGLHYCSLENKLTSQIYSQNSGIKTLPYEIFSDKDFFIKSAKAYGNNAKRVKNTFDKCQKKIFYNYNPELGTIEFNPKDIKKLQQDIEVAVSYNIVEEQLNQKVLKEIKLDLTYPRIFEIENDI